MREQISAPQYVQLSFEERLLLVDLECTRRSDSRIKRRLKLAEFPVQAAIEGLDFSPQRGLERRLVLKPAQCNWRSCLTIIVTEGDWMRDPIQLFATQGLLEVFDDRFGKTATIIASQVPVAEWHDRFPDPTLADAILDRSIHNAYRLSLTGDSQRKLRGFRTMPHT